LPVGARRLALLHSIGSLSIRHRNSP
jgi:hypothetical protein